MLRKVIASAAIAALVPTAALAGAQGKKGADKDFSAYDADKSGQLDQTEFSSWFVASKQKELSATGRSATPAELDGQVATAFARADADQDAKVSKEEMTRFLAG